MIDLALRKILDTPLLSYARFGRIRRIGARSLEAGCARMLYDMLSWGTQGVFLCRMEPAKPYGWRELADGCL